MGSRRYDYPGTIHGTGGHKAVIISMPADEDSLEEAEEVWRCQHAHFGRRGAEACAMNEIKRRWTAGDAT